MAVKPFPHRPDPARRRKRAGSALLENVFTLMPTFALIFAFIDFSLALFRWSTLQNAVREGVRYAVTFQRQGSSGQDLSIMNVVQSYSMGLVTATQSPQKIFVNYYAPTNTNTPIAAPGGNIPGNIVEVSVQNMSWQWVMPLSGSFGGTIPAYRNTTPLSINVFSSDILGGYPPGVTSVPR